MKNVLAILILYGLILTGCQKDSQENIMRVNHYTVSCTGEMTGRCLLVQRNENLNTDNWEYFYYYNSIKGFDYEEGYTYTLNVREEKVENPPADGSSLSYTLIKVVSKKKHSN